MMNIEKLYELNHLNAALDLLWIAHHSLYNSRTLIKISLVFNLSLVLLIYIISIIFV